MTKSCIVATSNCSKNRLQICRGKLIVLRRTLSRFRGGKKVREEKEKKALNGRKKEQQIKERRKGDNGNEKGRKFSLRRKLGSSGVVVGESIAGKFRDKIKIPSTHHLVCR